MAIKSKDRIYFDTDCISSFLWTDTTYILANLYGNKIVVPTLVLEELKKVEHLYKKLDKMINVGVVKTQSFSFNSEEFEIYTLLKVGDKVHPKIGNGEASVISLAKCNEATMASNNLKDISYYIKYYQLNNLTTADILNEALQKGIIDDEEVEEIWQKMRKRRQKMPENTFIEWMNSKK